MGTKLFYRERSVSVERITLPIPSAPSTDLPIASPGPITENFALAAEEEDTLPKPVAKTEKRPVAASSAAVAGAQHATPPLTQAPAIDDIFFTAPVKTSNFFATLKTVPNDSLLKIREDIGDCERCKLHKKRNHIVLRRRQPQGRIAFRGGRPGSG